MHVRCPHCTLLQQIRTATGAPPPGAVLCGSCGGKFRIPAAAPPPAVKPAAEEVLPTESDSKPAGDEFRPGSIDELSYDPDFAPAVSRGCLTPLQALHRGQRDVYARTLVNRHEFPEELAYRVTDNRLSLHEAMRQRRPPPLPSIPATPRRHVTSSQKRLVLCAAALIVAMVGYRSWSTWNGFVDRSRGVAMTVVAAPAIPEVAAAEVDPVPRADRPAARGAVSVEVDRNETGQVTAIRGPDPRAVLVGYCTHDAADSDLEPMELAAAVPPFPGRMVGIYQNAFRPGELFAIRIRHDQNSGRWVAGDGSAPIRVIEDYRTVAGQRRVPVRTQ